MARPRKTKPTTETKSSAFLEALKFIGLILKDTGPPIETHILIQNNTIVANNGTLSAGVKIQEDLIACPHNNLMIAALSKCGDNFSITQDGSLTIKSGKFKAVIPCLDPSLLHMGYPDSPVAIIDDRLKPALEAAGSLASENGQLIYHVSVLLNGHSIVGSNGHMIFEYWHGIHLPNGLPIPKAVIDPLIKSKKKLTKFGFSQSSVTFYFEDDSWIKTQLMAGEWPDVSHILNSQSTQRDFPADFWKGFDAVAPFSTSGLLWFDQGCLRSHPETGVGASFELPGLPRGPIMSIKQLALVRPYAKTIDFFVPNANNQMMTMFYGDAIRGVVAGRE